MMREVKFTALKFSTARHFFFCFKILYWDCIWHTGLLFNLMRFNLLMPIFFKSDVFKRPFLTHTLLKD